MIDGRDHLVGRLASIVAKKLLQGVKIVVVRCELLAKSGHVFRSQRKALQVGGSTEYSRLDLCCFVDFFFFFFCSRSVYSTV